MCRNVSPNDPSAQIADGLIRCDDGVVVQDQKNVLFFAKCLFYVVDDVVAFERVHFGGHLHVGACEASAGTVIVDDESLRVEHAGIAGYLAVDMLDEFGVGSFSEQGVYRIADKFGAAIDNEGAYGEARPAVEVDAEEFGGKGGGEHGSGRYDVVARVGGGGHERA